MGRTHGRKVRNALSVEVRRAGVPRTSARHLRVLARALHAPLPAPHDLREGAVEVRFALAEPAAEVPRRGLQVGAPVPLLPVAPFFGSLLSPSLMILMSPGCSRRSMAPASMRILFLPPVPKVKASGSPVLLTHESVQLAYKT